MESEIEKLRCDLQRYRRLFNPYGCVTDRQLRNTLKELIAETEARLHAIEAEAAETKVVRISGVPGSTIAAGQTRKQLAAGGK
jgi:hypothetical protein